MISIRVGRVRVKKDEICFIKNKLHFFASQPSGILYSRTFSVEANFGSIYNARLMYLLYTRTTKSILLSRKARMMQDHLHFLLRHSLESTSEAIRDITIQVNLTANLVNPLVIYC